MDAGITVHPMTAHTGAEIRGVDLAQPLVEAHLTTILDTLYRRGVIFFRGQQLTAAQFAAFAGRLGELDVHHMTEHTLPGLPQVRVLSNARKDGKAVGISYGGMHWHSDLSYKARPAFATLLYALQCPPSGADTEFANLAEAFDALTAEERERLKGLSAEHDRAWSYPALYPNRPPLTAEQIAKVPPVEHPLVRRHPQTGRLSLFIDKDTISHVSGMPDDEGRELVRRLQDFCTQSQFCYAHRWLAGDVLIWDNRSTLHRATPFDRQYDRTLYRIQVKGEVPLSASLAA